MLNFLNGGAFLHEGLVLMLTAKVPVLSSSANMQRSSNAKAGQREKKVSIFVVMLSWEEQEKEVSLALRKPPRLLLASTCSFIGNFRAESYNRQLS